jgi:NAD(P)-dependent dehydrogenase (short-subunit alcohol dehydrogenase family)
LATTRFSDRVAIVTGAAGGFGSAIAGSFAAEGARVLVADIDVEGATRVADEIGAGGGTAVAVACDVSRAADWKNLAEISRTRFGRLDILVNNAAILDMTPYDELTHARFAEVVRVNLDGALICTLAAVPALVRAGGGRILNIASIMGIRGARESIPYASAKGGVVYLSLCLACDLAAKGITVNAIAPGFIDTRMAVTRDGTHEHATELFRTVYLKYEKIPLGRAGLPDDIAGPAFFLCCDDARYVTGQVLVVDGGVTMTF